MQMKMAISGDRQVNSVTPWAPIQRQSFQQKREDMCYIWILGVLGNLATSATLYCQLQNC